MVEYTSDMNFGTGGAVELDAIFTALSDATRRDMLGRITKFELSVSELAEPYHLTIAAVSKHLKVLERAGLITKRKDGRKRYIFPAAAGFKDAAEWLDYYKSYWESNFEAVALYVEETIESPQAQGG